MSSPLREKIESVNTRIGVLLAQTRGALGGERDFGVEQVRQISALIETMAPVTARAPEVRRTEPETADGLDRYKAQLAELQIVLDQVRVMLMAKRAQMEAGRVQLDAVKNWTIALQQTR